MKHYLSFWPDFVTGLLREFLWERWLTRRALSQGLARAWTSVVCIWVTSPAASAGSSCQYLYHSPLSLVTLVDHPSRALREFESSFLIYIIKHTLPPSWKVQVSTAANLGRVKSFQDFRNMFITLFQPYQADWATIKYKILYCIKY
jgi:hypothetical protein